MSDTPRRERIQFYGAVTVSERGQVVIPAQARRDLNIEVGEKLLVLGGPGGGIVLIRSTIVSQMLSRWAEMARQIAEKGLLDISDTVEAVDERTS